MTLSHPNHENFIKLQSSQASNSAAPASKDDHYNDGKNIVLRMDNLQETLKEQLDRQQKQAFRGGWQAGLLNTLLGWVRGQHQHQEY